MSHLKKYYVKYLVLVVIILIVALSISLLKTDAINNYAFKRQIGGVISSSTKFEAYINSPSGIVIDSADNMYVTTDGYLVQKFSPTGTLLLTFGSKGTTTGKISYIERLAIDASDNLYITDGPNAKVLKFNSNGNFLFEFGSYDTGNSNGTFQYPESVGFNPVNNYIYVSDYNRNDIQVFDTNGNYIEKFGSAGTGNGQFNGPVGITFDSNNDIYVVDYSNHRIQKFASTTHAFISKFGIQGSGDGQFNSPTNVVLDTKGDLFVSDTYNNRVQKFSSTTNAFISKFGTTGSGDGQIDNGYGDIAIDSSDNIYVAESYNGRVSKFSSAGAFITKYASAGNGDGEFTWPIGIDLDSNGNIYVGDDANQRIQKFDNNGNFLLKFGTPGTGDGQFANTNSINALVVDSANNVYVSDVGVGRIQKFDSNGNFLLKWNTNSQNGLAVDPSTGNIYATENNGIKRISVYSATGTPLFTFGTAGTGNGQFTEPMGITITPQGYVYVGDDASPNQRIQKFDLNGNYISQFGSSGSGNGQLLFYTFLFYMDSDASGNVYVADYYNNRVQKFDGNGNFLSKFSTTEKLSNPMGIALDASNNIYLTNLYGNRVVVYGASPLLISNASSSVDTSSATITWVTSANGSSIVEFGPSSLYGSSTMEINTSPRVTAHSVTINNLPSCSTFVYRVKSTNDSAVTTVGTSSSFTTTGCTNMAAVTASSSVNALATATSTVTLETIELSIPPAFATVTATTTFQAKKLEPTAFYQGAGTPSGQKAVGTSVFNLVAIESNTNNIISTFSSPILVSLTYSPSDLGTIYPNTLSIYRYDGSSWYPLSNCSTNTTTNTVSCYTSNFSDFALFATPLPVQSQGGGGIILPTNAQVSNPPSYAKATEGKTAQNPIQQATNSLNNSTYKFTRTLKRGMSGTDVSILQQYLSRLPGIYPEALITGYFGNLTYKAVQRYQCKYNVVCQGNETSTGWGVVGKRTRGTLNGN